MNPLTAPRSLRYFVLRACERLHLSDAEFQGAGVSEQLHWLAYDQLRREEEAAAWSRGLPQTG